MQPLTVSDVVRPEKAVSAASRRTLTELEKQESYHHAAGRNSVPSSTARNRHVATRTNTQTLVRTTSRTSNKPGLKTWNQKTTGVGVSSSGAVSRRTGCEGLAGGRSGMLPYALRSPEPKAPDSAALQRLAVFVVEVVEGSREVHQLGSIVTEQVVRALQGRRRARLAARTFYRDMRRIIPHPGPAHMQQITAGVIEASVNLKYGRAARAVFMRLETVSGRWRVTKLGVL